MKMTFKISGIILAMAAMIAVSPNAKAIILAASADPNFNTTAPAGPLADSGWNLQGKWGGCLGTPIAPNYFVAARHVGGAVGQQFFYNGLAYTTVSFVDSPTSDLRIWKVDGVFSTYAELYTNNDELGKPLVVFGRGTQAGEDIYVPRYTTSYTLETITMKSSSLTRREIKKLMEADPLITLRGQTLTYPIYTESTNYVLAGWRWGKSDGVMRWGENKVIGAGDFLVAEFRLIPTSVSTLPTCLPAIPPARFSFRMEANGNLLESIMVWKGRLHASFHAAVFDKTGLFKGSYQVPDDGVEKPACFYATRISRNLDWIQSVINQ